MVSTFLSNNVAAIERSEYILKCVEDIKSNSESLLARTKDMMSVIFRSDTPEDSSGLGPIDRENGESLALGGAKISEEWLQRLVRIRALRDNHFESDLFCDPAWNMVLDLTLAHVSGKQISVSSLCVASGVPATTALRRIDDLINRGIAKRLKDPTDGRRVFVVLTEDGLKRVMAFLDALALIFADNAAGKRTVVAMR